MPRRYITVSIPYVNADPHLGYALELVEADVLARLYRASGDEVRFLGGTDDHALKNALAAEAAGVATQDFVDANASRFQALQDPLAVHFDDFIRTSSDRRHRPTVEALWRLTAANGDFYRRRYQGQYCVGCEQFYSSDELVDGKCREHDAPTELVAEENWFFRLARYETELERVLATGELRIEPEVYAQEALAFVRSGLSDISVSRSRARARGWGIPVPGDPEQVVYVWWDALANYISALDFGGDRTAYRHWWLQSDERIHIIGKGILRFHAVYWPALLLSAGQPLPTTIFVHPYLKANGQKLSKTTGNVVHPVEVTRKYGTDALRWWLLADVPRMADADYTSERLMERHDQDLANGIGNLTSRVVTMLHRFRGGTAPAPRLRGATVDEASAAAARFDLRALTHFIQRDVDEANCYIEANAPWLLAKAERQGDVEAAQMLDECLANLGSRLHDLQRSLAPLLPDTARRLAAALQPNDEGRIPPSRVLIPRLRPGSGPGSHPLP